MNMTQDEALNRAILESIRDAEQGFPNKKLKSEDAREEEKKEEPRPNFFEPTFEEPTFQKPPDPPRERPPGKKELKTVIRNGWVTKEWV